MATLSSAISYARVISGKDANTLKDDPAIAFANDGLLWLRQRLAERRKDLFATETAINIAATHLVGGATPGTFSVPTGTFLVLKALSVNLTDPTDLSQFKVATQVDPSNTPPGTSFDWLRKNQPADQPLFDYRGSTFEILPTPTVALTGAVKAWTFTAPTEYTTTGDTIAYPESINYRILSYLIAAFYLYSIGEDTDAAIKERRAEAMIESIISVVGTGTQQPTQTKGVGLTGFEF